MKKFVFVYYGTKKAEEVDEAIMQKWGAWFGSMGENLVDGGNPFNVDDAYEMSAKETTKLAADQWPAKGYSIVNAESMEAAQEMAKGCPVLEDDPDGMVRVYEAMPM